LLGLSSSSSARDGLCHLSIEEIRVLTGALHASSHGGEEGFLLQVTLGNKDKSISSGLKAVGPLTHHMYVSLKVESTN
jgi:hypothetical protein